LEAFAVTECPRFCEADSSSRSSNSE